MATKEPSKPLYTPEPSLDDGEELLWCDGRIAIIAKIFPNKNIRIHGEHFDRDPRFKENRGFWTWGGNVDGTPEQFAAISRWLNSIGLKS